MANPPLTPQFFSQDGGDPWVLPMPITVEGRREGGRRKEAKQPAPEQRRRRRSGVGKYIFHLPPSLPPRPPPLPTIAAIRRRRRRRRRRHCSGSLGERYRILQRKKKRETRNIDDGEKAMMQQVQLQGGKMHAENATIFSKRRGKTSCLRSISPLAERGVGVGVSQCKKKKFNVLLPLTVRCMYRILDIATIWCKAHKNPNCRW